MDFLMEECTAILKNMLPLKHKDLEVFPFHVPLGTSP